MSKYAWNTLVVLRPELFFLIFSQCCSSELAERGLHHVSRIAEATMSHVFSIESQASIHHMIHMIHTMI